MEYSDRRVANIGYDKNNVPQQRMQDRIKQDFRENGLFNRLTNRRQLACYDWRILFNTNRDKATEQEQNEVDFRLFKNVTPNTYGRIITRKNQSNLLAKNEKVGQIGIYPRNFEKGNLAKNKNLEEFYQNFVATAYHESSHAERSLKHQGIPQNSLAEEYQAFRREEVIRRMMKGKERIIPSLQRRTELFDEKILPAYYPDVIDGNYLVGKIPKFILEGKHRLPFEQKRPSQLGTDGCNFSNIIYHGLKTGNSELLEQYGYNATYDKSNNKLEVSKNNKSILVSTRVRGEWTIEKDDLNLTEPDILNSYKIAQDIDRQQTKTKNNSMDSRGTATRYHAPNKQVVATKSMRSTLISGLQLAKTSPSTYSGQTKQKLLNRSRGKSKNTEEKGKIAKSAFSQYIPTKTKQKPSSTKEIER